MQKGLLATGWDKEKVTRSGVDEGLLVCQSGQLSLLAR
jgi:hypothetical protein